MNRLEGSLSPYLRSHAGNPVDWYPWGEAAFAAARERDVPVLVSIGYATCHWCHVMARESFSDPAVAAVLNEQFVAIKVDREEHPDVDASFLAAASAFTKQLGWPLTVFATSEGRAFYAGTYFPPRAVQGVPAFVDVLAAVTDAWRERRNELDETAGAVAEALGAASVASISGNLPDAAALDSAVALLAAEEDHVHGGFGGAPKFPVAPVLDFLAASGGAASGAGGGARDLAERTLLAMGRSPLRDPVEGGFFRYATRADWSEPHYERMLTDNALLLRVLAELMAGADAAGTASAAASADTDELADLASGVAVFLQNVMQLPSGGFASAQDSESDVDGVRSEGGYYALTAEERRSQPAPALDDKVLAGWNGLAIGALARYAAVVGDTGAGLEGADAEGADALAAATRAARKVLDLHLRADGTLVRASLGDEVSHARATLEDVGMLAGGLLDLALATGEASYAVTARALIDGALAAGASGSPSSTAVFAPPGGVDPVLAARGLAMPDDPAEGATPSGLTACADAAWRLAALGAGDRYLEAAQAAMGTVAGIAVQRPIAFGGSLALMRRLASPLVQLVTVVPDAPTAAAAGTDPSDDGAPGAVDLAEPLTVFDPVLGAEFRPAFDPTVELIDATRRHTASVTAIVTESQARAFAAAGFELFEGRAALDGEATAYRCEAFICALPVHSAADLATAAAAAAAVAAAADLDL